MERTHRKAATEMKKIIRLTESDLHKIVKESVKRILKEGCNAWRKYPEEDQNEAMLDALYDPNGEWVDAYLEGDPMVLKITGNTLRDHLKATMGNDITH